MAKRKSTTTRTAGTARAKKMTGRTKPDTGAIERRLLAVAEQVGWVAGKLASVARRSKPQPAPKRARKTPRSGGTVDAPGKKHRKPAPADPRLASAARTPAALAKGDRAAATASKTTRRYARG